MNPLLYRPLRRIPEVTSGEMPRLIADFNFKSLLDAPCSDYRWVQHMQLPDDVRNLGIVPALVASKQQKHGSAFQRRSRQLRPR
jgi:hypothetical protein